jgi:8-oxo-dGTP diphosphatase
MAYPILVTAAIIENEDRKYLITQRPKDTHNALRWEFPGGKLHFGEDPRDCLEREIMEELGIKIKAGDILGYSSKVYTEEKHIVLLGFICRYVSGKIKKIGINDYAWVSPAEMHKYDITEADIPFVEVLKMGK